MSYKHVSKADKTRGVLFSHASTFSLQIIHPNVHWVK